jgi:hypothetical protein
VIEEAEEAKERGILVPVFLDAVRPPRGFRSIQAADLSGWPQGKSSPAVASFLTAVAKLLGKEGHATEDAPPALPNTPGTRSQGADQSAASPGSASIARLQWPSSLSGRRLILGGLGAVALLGTGAFLAWPDLWAGKYKEPAHRISVGDNVIARWSDDCLYSATVLQVQSDKYLVHYEFVEESLVDARDVIELTPLGTLELPPGTEVYAKPSGRQAKWLRSVILRHEDGKYLVALARDKCINGATHIWVEKDQLTAAS